MKLFILLSSINILFASKAQAYIDPGSGSIILQALLGVVAAAGATVGVKILAVGFKPPVGLKL